MSIQALKSRLAASGSAFVFLITATMLLQHAGATTSSTSTPCYDESFACVDDTECTQCITISSVDADYYVECISDYDYDVSDACTNYWSAACCAASLSSNDCMGNTAFVAYHTCFASYSSDQVGGGQCSVLTCSDGRGGGVEGDDAPGTDDAVGDDDDATVADDATGTDEDTTNTTDDDATGADDNVTVTDDAATSSVLDVCSTEYGACSDDTECTDCLTAFSVDDYTECIADYDYDGSDTCAYYWASPCCADSSSSNDCLGNTAFVGYHTCVASYISDQVGGGECSTITCSDGSGGGGELEVEGGTSGVGSSSPSAMLMLFLGLSFLTASPFLDILL